MPFSPVILVQSRNMFAAFDGSRLAAFQSSRTKMVCRFLSPWNIELMSVTCSTEKVLRSS